MSLATIVMFAASYFTLKKFPSMMEWFTDRYGHPGGAFLVFLVVCLLCAVVVWLTLPETKDKFLEEIASSG